MNEIKIKLDDVHPIEILGINNQNLKIIQHAYPKLKVIARGNEIIVKGEEAEATELIEKIKLMVSHILRNTTLSSETSGGHSRGCRSRAGSGVQG